MPVTIKRTYSRRGTLAQQQPAQPFAKRRRIEDATTIQSDATRSSPVAARSSSPPPFSQPSSPHSPTSPRGHRLSTNATPPTSPPPTTSQPTSECLSKQPLREISNNIATLPPQMHPKYSTTQSQPLQSSTIRSKPKPKRLVQMTLDLGGNSLRKRCKTCGMEFTPSNAEDTAVHKRFHAQNVGGVDVPRGFVAEVERMCHSGGVSAWRDGDGEGGVIVCVTRRGKLGTRNVVERVLEVVERELGGVGIPLDRLWGVVDVGEQLPGRTTSTTELERYKAFLYIKGQKCVGFCLAERITSAFPVIGTNEDGGSTGERPQAVTESSSITTSTTSQTASLGISRIWVSSCARQKGVARTLLELTRRKFMPGTVMPQHTIAFSQPTESGGRLARRWFGKASGWLVYAD